MNLILLAIVVCLIVIGWYIVNFRTNLTVPAVKGAYPILGNAYQLDKKRPDRNFLQWARELGPIYSVRILHKTWVVVSGYDELQEMLVTKGHEFGGRKRLGFQEAVLGRDKDLVTGNTTDPEWKPLRMAAHRGIRHYGDGMTRLEETMAVMAKDFVEKVKSHDGQPVNLHDDIYNFVTKVAMTMICGKKVKEDSDTILCGMKLLEQLVTQSASITAGVELELFPWLIHFGHPIKKRAKAIRNLRDQLWEEMWEESKKTYTSDGEGTCIMHSIHQLTDKDSPHYNPTFGKEHERGLFTNLVLASVISTTKFSYSLPNILLNNPKVLKRVQQEIDDVIGSDRQPSIFDREAMPYSVATILELLRYAALLTTLPHAAQVTATLGGYTIPAGTNLMPLFPAVLHDEKFWGDPEVFRPERFLDEDERLLPADHPNRKHMIQFGAGTRVCVGEAFALKRLFIFMTSIVQAFELLPGSDTLVPCDRESMQGGALLSMSRYTVKLVPRKTK